MRGSNALFFGTGSSLLLAFRLERRHGGCCSAGPTEHDRFPALELVPEAVVGAEGLVMASGSLAPITGKTLAA